MFETEALEKRIATLETDLERLKAAWGRQREIDALRVEEADMDQLRHC
jgi:hypothetical protein